MMSLNQLFFNKVKELHFIILSAELPSERV